MANQSYTLQNCVKLLGETLILPGSSLMMEGRIGSGVAHTLVAMAAGAVLGPIGTVLVAANSYSKSVNDQSILELGTRAIRDVQAPTTQAPTTQAPTT